MKHQQKGVTLVELMVVIALISLIFVVSFRVLTSYLNRTSFRQGVNQFASQLNDVFNDVAVGNFEPRGIDDVWCNKNSGSPAQLSYSKRRTASEGIGTRQYCVFVGKAVQLGVGDGTATVIDRDSEFVIHTLIGLRDDIAPASSGGQALNKFNVLENILDPANQVAPTDSQLTAAASFTASVTKDIPYGLEVTGVYYEDGSDAYFLDGLGVMLTQFGATQTTDNFSILGGARSINMRPVFLSNGNETDSTRKRASETDFLTRTSSHHSSTYYQNQVSSTIIICLASGSGNHRAYLDIGNRGGALTATAYLEGDDVSNTRCATYG